MNRRLVLDERQADTAAHRSHNRIRLCGSTRSSVLAALAVLLLLCNGRWKEVSLGILSELFNATRACWMIACG